MRRVSIIALAGAVCISVLATQFLRSEAVRPELRTHSVQLTTIQKSVSLSGSLTPTQRAPIVAGISGRIELVLTRDDEIVTRYQPLIRLESSRQRADYERRRIAARRAKAVLDDCLDKSEGAADSHSTTAGDESCEMDRLALDLALVEEKDAARILEQTLIRATIAGRVWQLNAHIGDLVSIGPGQSLGMIVSSTLSVDVEGDEHQTHEIQPGMSVSAAPELRSALVVNGRVAEHPRLKRPRSSAASLAVFGFRVDLDELSEAELRLGTTMRLDIEVGKRSDVLAVPTTALVDSGHSIGVIVMVDGDPQFRPVTIGLEDDEMTQVVDGLKFGDRVVVAEGEVLRNLARRDTN